MSQITLETTKLQKMVAKVVKGASNNKLLAITSMLEIKYDGSTLSLRTTDRTQYVIVKCSQGFEGKETEFSAVVDAELFSKLIAKTSCSHVTLSLKDNYLEVKADGTYKIPLPMEEDELVTMPEYIRPKKMQKVQVNLASLKRVIDNSSASVGVMMDEENKPLTGILFGEKALAGDGFKVAATDINVFGSTVLMAPETVKVVDLLASNKEDIITVHLDDNHIILEGTEDADKIVSIIEAVQIPDKDEYPVEAITEFLEMKFPQQCQISREAVLKILDRMSLFISEDDDNAVDLLFHEDKLTITSKKSNASETITFGKGKASAPFNASIDINMLKDQLEVQKATEVKLFFGDESAIRMETDKLIIIVSLKEEE